MDVMQVLPTEIYIEEDGSILTQAVEYDWQPEACPDCKSLNHAPEEYKKERKEPKQKLEAQRNPTRRKKFIPTSLTRNPQANKKESLQEEDCLDADKAPETIVQLACKLKETKRIQETTNSTIGRKMVTSNRVKAPDLGVFK